MFEVGLNALLHYNLDIYVLRGPGSRMWWFERSHKGSGTLGSAALIEDGCHPGDGL